jgi:serine/threonine protein kinase
MLSVGTLLDNRYEVVSLIGTGGMAAVYKASEVSLGRTVAVKIMHDSFAEDSTSVERFKREAQLISSLRHPNILTCFRMGFVDGIYYSCLEYVNAGSLATLLSQCHHLDWTRAVPLIMQLCDGVEHAHSAGILHRDLTPNNILILIDGDQDTVKLVDFGLAKSQQAPDTQKLTQTGTAIGTVYYMSPEQCRGEAIDSRSDIYAIGCILYQCLTGEPPFVASDPVGLMVKHVSEAPNLAGLKLSNKTEYFQAVIAKCLAKSREQRYSTAGQLKEDLLLISKGRRPLHAVSASNFNKAIPILASIVCALAIVLMVTVSFRSRLISTIANSVDDKGAEQVMRFMDIAHDKDSKALLIGELARKYKSREQYNLSAARIYAQYAALQVGERAESAIYVEKALACIRGLTDEPPTDRLRKRECIETAQYVIDSARSIPNTNEECVESANWISNSWFPRELRTEYARYSITSARAIRSPWLAPYAYRAFPLFTDTKDQKRLGLDVIKDQLHGGKLNDAQKLQLLIYFGLMNFAMGQTAEAEGSLQDAIALWDAGTEPRQYPEQMVSGLLVLAALEANKNNTALCEKHLAQATALEESYKKQPPSPVSRFKVLAALSISLKQKGENLSSLYAHYLRSPSDVLEFEKELLDIALKYRANVHHAHLAHAACQIIFEQNHNTEPLFANFANASISDVYCDDQLKRYSSGAQKLRQILGMLEHPNPLSTQVCDQMKTEVLRSLVDEDLRIDKWKDAMDAFDKLEKLPRRKDDKLSEMQLELSRSSIMRRQGRLQECEQRLISLLNSCPGSLKTPIFLRLTELMAQQNRLEEARSYYYKWRENARLDPAYTEILRELGNEVPKQLLPQSK